MCEVFTTIGMSLGLAGAAATAAGVGITAGAGAALGSGVGMLTAAIKHGDIGKGALFGALGGGVLAPVGAVAGGALSGGFGAVAGTAGTVTTGMGAIAAGGVGGGVLGGAVGGMFAGSGDKKGANKPTEIKSGTTEGKSMDSRVAETAKYAKASGLQKRTLSSLRIPLTNKVASNVGLNTGTGQPKGTTSTSSVGLNIPM